MKRLDEFYVYYIDKNDRSQIQHDWLFAFEWNEDVPGDWANKVSDTIDAWEREHPNFEIVSDVIFVD